MSFVDWLSSPPVLAAIWALCWAVLIAVGLACVIAVTLCNPKLRVRQPVWMRDGDEFVRVWMADPPAPDVFLDENWVLAGRVRFCNGRPQIIAVWEAP